MLGEYPLQQHARQRAAQSQRTFRHRAKAILTSPDDCLLQESVRGLTLLARNEEALAAAALTLRKVFGPSLELTPPQVRLTGTPPHEPIMNVRANVPASRIEPVKRILHRRGIAVLEESAGGTRCLLRAEAPLARLLGLGADLKGVTLGTSLLWTELAHYAPCPVNAERAAA